MNKIQIKKCYPYNIDHVSRRLVRTQMNNRSYLFESLLPLKDLIIIRNVNLWDCQINDLTPLEYLVNLQKILFGVRQLLVDTDITPLKKLVNLETIWVCKREIEDVTSLIKFLTDFALERNITVYLYP
jgi:hypothetical protein